MAVVPLLIVGPSSILSLIGLIRGPDKTIPTPPEDWRNAVVNVVIPAFNEEEMLPLCLASLMQQTLKPNKIIIIDDGSSDKTLQSARTFCEANSLDFEVIPRASSIGKVPSLKRQAREFEADVEFILDGDTVLQSPNYIARTVEELYKAIGIGTACGTILPLYNEQRKQWLNYPAVHKFLEKMPESKAAQDPKMWDRINHWLVNIYRDVLYFYLQRFIYVGQMAFFGSITNPVGCAVAYRQKYLKDVFDKYEPLLGDNITNSEDIFLGFAMINKGYRNIQLQDVFSRSKEPKVENLPKQLYLWSSAIYQSSYYFPNIIKSPFKALKRRREQSKITPAMKKEIGERRKIKEPYRQTFGEERTQKLGRPMGWVILISLFEKVSFSFILWLMIIMGWWTGLLITVIAESSLALLFTVIVAKGKRWEYLLKGIVATPLRYMTVLLDIFAFIHFSLEAWVFKRKVWRK